jgi:competence protein ComEC
MVSININTVNIADLQFIIHIGPIRAAEIIKRRPLRDVYELSYVPGLGKIRMDAIIAQGLVII